MESGRRPAGSTPVNRRDTVLVVGPPLSGASAVATALRGQLSDCEITESASARHDVVVFVVSAAAPMAACDTALLQDIAAGTDAVIAVVAKIDVHRTWRTVLDANRVALARTDLRSVPWLGVAADPQLGPSVIDPLVDALWALLGDTPRRERNQRRAAERAAARRHAHAAERAALRAEVRDARLDLAAAARARAVALRAELQRHAASASRRDLAALDERVRTRVVHTADEFGGAVAGRFAELGRRRGLAVPDVPPAPPVWSGLPPPHRPAQDGSTVVFAAAFGFGAALTLGRLLIGLLGVAVPGVLAGSVAVGVSLTVWVVRTRRLAVARLAADRWIAEVAAGLRCALEDRVLAAESSLLIALAGEGRNPN